MHGEEEAGNNRPKVSVSAEESKRYKQMLTEFQSLYEAEQAQFNYSEEDTYYIVSTAFMNSWRDFCMSTEHERHTPLTLNQDLIDSETKSLKKDLKEKVDFEFITPKIFSLFKEYQGVVIKRNAIKLGSEKRIPVYLNSYHYLTITKLDLKHIDQKQKKRTDFVLTKIEQSQNATVQGLLKKIAQEKQYDSMNYEVRLWRVDKKQNLETLFNYLKVAADRATYEYKIKGFGKKLSNESKIEDLQMEQGDFFVVEVKEKGKSWFLQSENEKKCQGCYEVLELKFPCKCEKVAYCTQACKEKDKRFHLRNCEFAELEELNKPVDMTITSDSSLGVVGLRNLGNTCFMNSCLQCLSNTEPLTQYFIKNLYDKEINKVNKLGTKGKLAKTYAKFIKGMWCETDNVFSPDNIKGAVASINPMFSGYAQHDSQEFFSFLVDGLHEDLNRVLQKPIVESVESNNRSDDIVALESWISHIRRNQSIVTDLMTGQYKSKVTCPDCGKQSITFDPFITITLPIPQKVVNVMETFIIFKNFQAKTKRVSFTYQKPNPEEWLKKATSMIDMDQKQFRLYAVSMTEGVYKAGRQSTNQIIHKIESQSKNMFCIQLTEEQLNFKETIEITGRFSKKGYYASSEFQNLWFKFPFFFEKETTTGLTIFKRMLKFLYSQGYDDSKPRAYVFGGKSYEQYEEIMLNKRPFEVHLRFSRRLERYFHKLEYKFDGETIIRDDELLVDILKGKDEKDCELDIRFSKSGIESFTFDKLKDFEDHGKKAKAPSNSSEDITVDISNCFETLRESERLETGNQWYCNKCKDHKLALKEMSIYKAPKIMILHLKRFKQKGILRKEKNQSKVLFPTVLNMKDYLIDSKPMSSYISQAQKQGVYIEPNHQGLEIKSSKDPIYELYAVSNHYGGLGGGHYTAYAKNGGKWYDYNDSSVRSCSESSICGSGAYMLFYKRND